jgi:hypothetical protein
MSAESNSTCCAICISEYSADDDCRLLPCSHYFHKQVRVGHGTERGSEKRGPLAAGLVWLSVR